MAIINYAAREMTAKIVYYGPGLSGKTTSIQYIHTKISPSNKGKLVSLATETDRTLFFDFFPVDFGKIGGFRVKFNFYTVPGQVFYNTTRKLVLKGADGVVFVADSQEGMKEQNFESLENLKENLRIHGLDPETIPFVIQFNKRDIPGAMPVAVMRRDINTRGVPDFETNAVSGEGIMEAMKATCKTVLEDLRNKQSAAQGKVPHPSGAAKAAAKPAAKPVAQLAKAAATPVAAPVAAPAAAPAVDKVETAERSTEIAVSSAGKMETAITLPLTLDVAENVENVKVEVNVKITYSTKSAGKVEVGELTTKAPSDGGDEKGNAPAEKKSFMSRLFGGG